MTPSDYIALRTAEGINETEALRELMTITGCKKTSAYDWLTTPPRRNTPLATRRLLSAYLLLPAEQQKIILSES